MDSFLHFVCPSCYISCSFLGPTSIKVPLSSRFEVGSNSAIVPDLVSEATAFFIRFYQLETMAFGSLGIASLIWRQCTIVVGISCKGFLLADP